MTILNLVSLEEAEAGLSRLIDQVRQGEHVLLVEDGVEIARIVPPVASEATAADGERKPKRQGGFLQGQIVEIDPDWWKPDDELADLFEGSESRFDELLGIPSSSDEAPFGQPHVALVGGGCSRQAQP